MFLNQRAWLSGLSSTLGRTNWIVLGCWSCGISLGSQAAHIDLAGDGGGDQGGAAFLKQLDQALLLGDQGVNLRSFAVEESCNGSLFLLRRARHHQGIYHFY